jgi:AbrB family looped-hinge helix DNA binding protein
MAEPATTKLSSKGQVVIPEEVRDRLGLRPGAQFIVIGDRDVVILKVIQSPDSAQFDEIVTRARKAARSSRLKKKDVTNAIRRVRNRK